MGYNKHFDLDDVFRTLGSVNEKYEEWSPEDEALRIAAVALVFIQQKDMLPALRDFLGEFYSTGSGRQPSRVFATQDQADEWLKEGTARDGELASIAGQGFQVVIRPARSFFLRTPLFEELHRGKDHR